MISSLCCGCFVDGCIRQWDDLAQIGASQGTSWRKGGCWSGACVIGHGSYEMRFSGQAQEEQANLANVWHAEVAGSVFVEAASVRQRTGE